MVPPLTVFQADELSLRVQSDNNGRKRKLPGGGNINLADCELLSMTQYACEVPNPEDKDCKVYCRPIERLYRRCADNKGKFLVETTEWEGKLRATAKPRSENTSGDSNQKHAGSDSTGENSGGRPSLASSRPSRTEPQVSTHVT